MRVRRSTGVEGDRGGVVVVSDHVDGRSRSAVAAVRALAAAGLRPVVTVSGGLSAARASRGCAGVLRVPPVHSAEYPKVIGRYLDDLPGSTVLPASDAVLVALRHPGAHLVDKEALAVQASAAGLPSPATRTFPGVEELVDRAGELDFPLVVKAAVKTGADHQVTRRVESAAELPAAVTGLSGAVVVQPWTAGTMRAVCGVIDQGRLLAVVHQKYLRIWPPDCGTASAAVTTPHDPDLEDRLPQLLAGHSGVFQVQLIGDQVIDVNPRVYGSLPLAVAAGANLPAIACRAGSGEPGLVRGRPGVHYRWLEGDVRRLVHDVRTRALSFPAAVHALAPVRGTAHSIESLRDPGPALVRLVDVARRRGGSTTGL